MATGTDRRAGTRREDPNDRTRVSNCPARTVGRTTAEPSRFRDFIPLEVGQWGWGITPLSSRPHAGTRGRTVANIRAWDRGRVLRPKLLPRASMKLAHRLSKLHCFWESHVGGKHTTHVRVFCMLEHYMGRGYIHASTGPVARYRLRRVASPCVGLYASSASQKAACATTVEKSGGVNAILAPVPNGGYLWLPRPNASRLISRAIYRIWSPT